MGSNEGQARSLTKDEVKRLIAITKNTKHATRNMAIIMLGLCSGLRVKEIANLTLSHILNADGSIRETASIGKGVSKGNKVGQIQLKNTDLRKALNEWLEVRQSDVAGDYLFYTQKKKQTTANYLAKLLLQIFKDSGLSGCSSHSLRRTFANTLMENGANIRDISNLLRHSSIATTQLYFDSSETKLGELVASLKY